MLRGVFPSRRGPDLASMSTDIRQVHMAVINKDTVEISIRFADGKVSTVTTSPESLTATLFRQLNLIDRLQMAARRL